MKFKKVLIGGAVVLTLCSSALGCMADTKEFNFKVKPPADQVKTNVYKKDSEQYFYVTTTSHNLKSKDAFWYGPRDNGTVMSTGLRITKSSNPRQKKKYSKYAKPKAYYQLRGNSRLSDIKSGPVYEIETSGRWTP